MEREGEEETEDRRRKGKGEKEAEETGTQRRRRRKCRRKKKRKGTEEDMQKKREKERRKISEINGERRRIEYMRTKRCLKKRKGRNQKRHKKKEKKGQNEKRGTRKGSSEKRESESASEEEPPRASFPPGRASTLQMQMRPPRDRVRNQRSLHPLLCPKLPSTRKLPPKSKDNLSASMIGSPLDRDIRSAFGLNPRGPLRRGSAGGIRLSAGKLRNFVLLT